MEHPWWYILHGTWVLHGTTYATWNIFHMPHGQKHVCAMIISWMLVTGCHMSLYYIEGDGCSWEQSSPTNCEDHHIYWSGLVNGGRVYMKSLNGCTSFALKRKGGCLVVLRHQRAFIWVDIFLTHIQDHCAHNKRYHLSIRSYYLWRSPWQHRIQRVSSFVASLSSILWVQCFYMASLWNSPNFVAGWLNIMCFSSSIMYYLCFTYLPTFFDVSLLRTLPLLYQFTALSYLVCVLFFDLVNFALFRVTYNFPLWCNQCMYAILFICSSSCWYALL